MSIINIAQAEQARRGAQVALDSQKSAYERNRLGQFATPPELALDIAKLAIQFIPPQIPIRFLDPAVGTGVFFFAARETFGDRIQAALGYEIDREVARKATELWKPFGLEVRVENFCLARAPITQKEKANLIFCNPPYVRHHHLDSEQKRQLQEKLKQVGVAMSGLAGLYNYFVVLSQKWLAAGGIAIWLIPAEFLDVNYGEGVKEFLTRDVTLLRLHRFSPHDVQFNDALVSSVVAVFHMEQPTSTSQVDFTSGSSLCAPQIIRSIPNRKLLPAAKWGPLFTGGPLNGKQAPDSLTVGELFHVKRGLATGANGFFILKRDDAHRLKISASYLRPILPSPREIHGDVVEGNADGFPVDIPELVLLDTDLPMEEIREKSPGLFAYLELGKEKGIADRYLTAHRRVWYSQEVRPPAPVVCTYMGRKNGGRSLRFIRNKSGATAPNVYLVLYPTAHFTSILTLNPSAMELVFEALREVSKNLAKDGRIYGGGLYKIEPKELSRVCLPRWLDQELPELSEFRLCAQ